ncbi:MAG: hypothetical protein PHF86_10660 [Candidatus Nanoarchaeia archaeon]|jgi:hypothetical protein|nr:hypothetical protein [Candidatus Nanoarchaeia archaeon]
MLFHVIAYADHSAGLNVFHQKVDFQEETFDDNEILLIKEFLQDFYDTTYVVTDKEYQKEIEKETQYFQHLEND